MTQTNTQVHEVNILKAAHEMAKAAGSEYGHYSVRLRAAIKAVWDMVKMAAQFDETLKVVTGAVKTFFSAEKPSQVVETKKEKQEESVKLFAHIYRANNTLGRHWVLRLSEPGGYQWHGQVAHTNFSQISEAQFKRECKEMFENIIFE